jgi:hypothetical protein
MYIDLPCPPPVSRSDLLWCRGWRSPGSLRQHALFEESSENIMMKDVHSLHMRLQGHAQLIGRSMTPTSDSALRAVWPTPVDRPRPATLFTLEMMRILVRMSPG